ncbi:MAG: hypothetical protein WAO76_00510 [Georgfuchsia sp.]
MSLVDRLAGIGDPDTVQKLSINTFWALLYELAKGKVSRLQLINYFQLSAEEITELDWIIARYNAQPNATAKASFVELMQVVFMLAEARVPGYTSNAELAARINAV